MAGTKGNTRAGGRGTQADGKLLIRGAIKRGQLETERGLVCSGFSTAFHAFAEEKGEGCADSN